MIITCPQCDTSFSLPDELYRPGKKARCSNCGNVFAMPALDAGQGATFTAPAEAVAPRPAPAKKRGIVPAAVAIVLLGLLTYGGFLIYSGYFAGDKAAADGKLQAAAPAVQNATKPSPNLVNSISLEDIRQFLVDNVEFGKLMVIQGFAVNTAGTGKDYISVEARVLDDNNTVLAQTTQLCGVPLTLFQLQTLPERELKETLNNRTTILVNNTNVPVGGKVPFVVVFPNPPAGMRTFEVQVVDARNTPAS
jgi:predicted Zn finger-like uncharacterized protein